MNSSSENQGKLKDLSCWFAIIVATAAAFFCTYYYSFSGPIQALIWLIWFVVVLMFTYMTTVGKQLFEFAQEAKAELLKVVWPNRQETVQTTTIVMVMVGVTGFILWGIDSIMMWAIAKLTHLG
ncbi:preprotein translocase subunit SecE [Legionella waltersii]|nr:preprotein translocase subunit SecE [Legionella waltersii]